MAASKNEKTDAATGLSGLMSSAVCALSSQEATDATRSESVKATGPACVMESVQSTSSRLAESDGTRRSRRWSFAGHEPPSSCTRSSAHADDKVVDCMIRLQETFWTALGRQIGKRPMMWLSFSFLIYLALLPGTLMGPGDGKWLWINMTTDFLAEFSFSDSEEWEDYQSGIKVFPSMRQISLAIKPKSGGSPLSAATLTECMKIVNALRHETTIDFEGAEISFDDLCKRSGKNADCYAVTPSSLLLGNEANAQMRLQDLSDLENNGADASARANFLLSGMHPQQLAFLPLAIGSGKTKFPGVAASQEQLRDWLAAGELLLFTFNLENSKAALEFEKAARSKFVGFANSNIEVSFYSTGSLGYELLAIMSDVIPLLLVTIAIMLIFVVVLTGADTRMPGETQVMCTTFGIVVPGLASFAGIGLMGYCGLPMNILCGLAPFLGIAVGVDQLFLLVSAVNSVPLDITDPAEVLAIAMPRAGTAASCSTTTAVIAFAVGAWTSSALNGFFVFCLALVFVLLLNFVGMMTAVPAVLMLNERRIEAGRRDLVPCLKRKAGGNGMSTSIMINKGVISKLAVGPRIKEFFAGHAAPALQSNLACQLIGAVLMISMLVGSAVVYPQIGKGMPDSYFLPDVSVTQDYLKDVEVALDANVPLPLSILLPRPLLHSEIYRRKVQTLFGELANRSDAILPPVCWVKDVADMIPAQADKATVANILGHFWSLSVVEENYGWDRVTSSDGDLLAARCHFFAWQPMDADKRFLQANELIDYASRAGLEAVAFHESFPIHVARYRKIKDAVLQTVGWALLSVLLSLAVFIPFRHAVIAVVMVAGVVLVMFGFMSLTETTFNAVTYSTCVMAIGFCVEYLVHVLHFTNHGVPADSGWEFRVAHALDQVGYDVLLGCSTAFIGVFCLSFHTAMCFRIFAANTLVITTIGGFFALWGLPACLALGSRGKRALLCRVGTQPEASIVEASADTAEMDAGETAAVDTHIRNTELGKAQAEIKDEEVAASCVVHA
eukprot:TRINITY_DN10471_c0_g1_i3.p1 TRINITY_DN10471_c0_g1~~TRINITY_DN10471_c0_g1_i3.p1  ORF type:complete len:1024 (-),score=185.59 TRINITY_DN10471_c0_g1_i3:129-3164(-)